MVKKILGTISSRIFTALISLLTILINGWFLGADKVGTISLIILAITMIQMLNNFVGGGALVYFFPRSSIIQLVVPAYCWALITSLPGTILLEAFHRIPDGYSWHVLFLSLILSLSSVNFMILMGQERIKAFNIINVIQILTFFIILTFWIFILKKREVSSYIIGLYVSYLIAFLGSFWMMIKNAVWGEFRGVRKVVKNIFRFGTVSQMGNVIQFFNYRLSYYFIQFFMSIGAVGIYTMGVQLSESLWLVSRSIHLVQFSRISNEKDRDYAARLTINLAKISFLITLVCLVLLYLLLILFFPFVFKQEFSPVKIIMLALAPGILAFSFSIILSPYFSGTGKPVHNTISAAIGLVFTLVLGWLLIPRMGFVGAGISASVSYSMATLYQFIVFVKISHVRAQHFIFRINDFREFITILKGSLKKVKIENRR